MTNSGDGYIKVVSPPDPRVLQSTLKTFLRQEEKFLRGTLLVEPADRPLSSGGAR